MDFFFASKEKGNLKGELVGSIYRPPFPGGAHRGTRLSTIDLSKRVSYIKRNRIIHPSSASSASYKFRELQDPRPAAASQGAEHPPKFQEVVLPKGFPESLL